MPLHLPNQSRREFVVSLAAGILMLLARAAPADDVDEDLVALLNDPHIGGQEKSDAVHPRNLQVAVDYVVALKRRPAAVFVNGDLALANGQPEDYAAFAKIIAPLHAAGMPVHLTLGNRDDREVFRRALAEEKPGLPSSRRVTSASSPRAARTFFSWIR